MRRIVRSGVMLVLFILITGCFKSHLYVQQERVDGQFLASNHAHTPDPRKANPPKGQRLILSWDFPLSIYKENLALVTTIRFWDNNQVEYRLVPDRKRGYHVYSFSEGKKRKGRILTYKVDVVNGKGEVIETWKHQFWSKLIDVDRSDSY